MDNVYVTVTMKNRASLNNDARVLRRQDSISLSIASKGRAATIEVYRRKTTTTPSLHPLQVSDLVGFICVVRNTVHCTCLWRLHLTSDSDSETPRCNVLLFSGPNTLPSFSWCSSSILQLHAVVVELRSRCEFKNTRFGWETYWRVVLK